jgi:uncharacterized protein (DUF1697 family)
MIDRRVAFLRGINVGTAKRIAMADLRELFESLGHDAVRTVLNSGNVVFTVTKKSAGDEATRIEKAIAARLGVGTRVSILTAAEVRGAVEANPLVAVADNPSRLLLVVLRDPKLALQLRPLLKQRWAPEALAIGKRVAYIWCGESLVDSRVWAAVNRIVGDGGTARNFTTMSKLAALAAATEGK